MLWRSFRAIIKKPKEVEADDSSECIWKYAKVRISVGITKPLKRIIFLKQKGEDNILILVLYERLPDFVSIVVSLAINLENILNTKDNLKRILPFVLG